MTTLGIVVKGLEPLERALSGAGAGRLGTALKGLRTESAAFAQNMTSSLQSIDAKLGGIADNFSKVVGKSFDKAQRNAERIRVEELRTARAREQAASRAADTSKRAAIAAGQALGKAEELRIRAAELRHKREEAAYKKERDAVRRTERERRSAQAASERARRDAIRKTEQEQKQAAKKRQEEEVAALKRQERIAKRISRVGRGIGAGGIGLGRGVGGVGSVLGTAFGGLGSGGGGVGGLIRGAGGIGSGLVGGVGGLGGSLLSTGGSLFSGAATTLGSAAGPLGAAIGGAVGGVGKALTGALAGALQGAAAIGSGVLTAATDLAGSIADRMAGVLKIGLAAGLVLAITSVTKAAQFEAIEEPFRNIAKAVGSEAVPALESMREATRGTVSDLDLMTQFNRAVQLGAAASVQDFNKLAEASRRLGKAVGRNAADSLEDLSIGLGRQSKLILDNLGIIVSAEGAYQSFADSMGKTSAQLTDVEKKQAFLAASMTAIDEALKKAGPEVETFSDFWNGLKATFENLFVSIGQTMLPVLTKIVPQITAIVKGIANWISENRVELANKLTSALSGVVKTLGSIAELINGTSPGEFFNDLKEAASTAAKFAELAFEEAGLRIESALTSAVLRALETVKAELKIGFANAIEAAIENPLTGLGLQVRLAELVSGKDITGDLKKGLGFDAAALRAQAQVSGSARAAEATTPIQEQIAELRRQREALPDILAPLNDRLDSIRGAGSGPGGPDPSLLGSLGNSIAEQAVTAAKQNLPGGGTIGSPSVPGGALGLPGGTSASTVEQLMRSGLASLETLGITLSELPPPLAAKFEDAFKTEEGVAKLRKAAEEHLAGEHERAAEAAIKANRERLQDIKKEEAAFKKALKAQQRLDERRDDALEGIAKQLEDANKRIEQRLAESLESIAKRTQDRINSLVDSKFGELAGLAGGIEADGGIPRNIRLAAKKVRRAENKARENSLRALTAGQSADDLAAFGGAGLRRVLAAQATIESVGKAIDISYEGLDAAREARATAEEDLRKAATDAAAKVEKALLEHAESSRELAEQTGRTNALTVETLKSMVALQEQTRAQLEQTEKELKLIKETVARATRLAR